MTDNEIIKALELCHTQDGLIPCYDCPCWDDGVQKCEGLNHADLLGLINRQKAEIERLKGSVIVNNIMESQKIKREAKIEAIKDFAKRLKEAACKPAMCNNGIPMTTDYQISSEELERILKEMVGETK